jgi:hypothetical protein
MREQALGDVNRFLQQLERQRLLLPLCSESSENAEAVRPTGWIGALWRRWKRVPER